MHSTRSPLAVLLVASLPAALAAQGSVLVVDDDGGVAFTEIQPAIDAAVSGDVILVRAGSYDGFRIAGKALEVVGEGADLVTVGYDDPSSLPVRVEGTPAGNGSSVTGMRIVGAGAPQLVVASNAGRVSLTGLWLEPSPGLTSPSGMLIAASALVIVQSTVVDGGGTPPAVPGVTVPALAASGSAVWVMDSVLEGARGPTHLGVCGQPTGPPGSPAIALTDSDLYLADTTAAGGSGGVYVCGSWFTTEIFGFGGAGVEARGASFLKVVRGEVRGGLASCSPAELGGDGFALFDASFLLLADEVAVVPWCGGTSFTLSGAAQVVKTPQVYPTLRGESPIGALGGLVALTITGEPSSVGALFLSPGFGPTTEIAGVDGATPLDVGSVQLVAPFALGADGSASLTATLPSAPSWLGVTLALQGVVLSPGDVAFTSTTELAIAQSAPSPSLPALPVLITHDGPDRMGDAVTGVGDIDGDGIPDLAIGAPRAAAGGSERGSVFVYSGTGALIRRINGTADGDWFGDDVANAGDVNGDGVPDQIVGAPQVGVYASGGGEALVVSGADAATLWAFSGTGTIGGFGERIDGAGDVDADGVPDLITGSYVGGLSPFYARVLSGATGAVLHEVTGAFVFGFSTDVAGAGDLDLDGFGDFVVGASGDDTSAPNAGAVHAFSGFDASELWRVTGGAPLEQLGAAVAPLADLDGDGVPEVLAGAPGANDFGFKAGRVRVLSGSTGAGLLALDGLRAHGELGHAVADAGDVDGDGVSDVIAGAPFDSVAEVPALQPPGSSVLFSGATGAPFACSFGDAGLPGSSSGASVAGIGDVDGDGTPDVVVGAPGHDEARVYHGQ